MIKPVLKKILGVILVLIGIAALVTPLTPGAWLIFVGLGLLEFRIAAWDKLKTWFKNTGNK